MYIPKFRTAEDVVIYFREQDPKSVITRGLIYNLVRNGKISGFDVGRKCVVNLDEIIFYLSGAVGYDMPVEQPTFIVTAKTAYKMQAGTSENSKHKSRFPKSACFVAKFLAIHPVLLQNFSQKRSILKSIFVFILFKNPRKEKDPATKLSRDCLREIVANGALGGVTSGIRTYFDFNKLMAHVSPTCFAPAPKKIPRLRNYEKTYHHIHKYTKLPITWDRLHAICHSGEVLCELHGNRWVVDFDVIKARIII